MNPNKQTAPSDKKLKSLANMAKRGYGNEQKIAIKLLKTLCKKHNLDYDSMLDNLLIEEFTYGYKNNKISKRLTIQVLVKYAMLEGDGIYWESSRSISIKTTKEKWNDFLVAIDEVRRKYNKQRRALLEQQKQERNIFFNAFINRHDLFYPYPREKKKSKKLTDKDLEEIRLSNRMAGEIDEDLQIHRQIGA